MKASGLFISFLFLVLRLNAQNVDNPSFDSIYVGGIDRVFEWITSDTWTLSSTDTIPPLNPSDHYISTSLQYHETLRTVQIEYSGAFDGNYAIKILSYDSMVNINGTPYRGFITNGNHFYTDSIGYIDLAKGGTPFPYRPYQLRGHYKFEDFSPSLNNYPRAVVLLKKYNATTQLSDTIGFCTISAQLFPTGNWRLFEMPITYFSNQIPDSLVIAFISPGIGFPSTLWIDSLGFDYSVTSVLEHSEEMKDFWQDYNTKTIHFPDPSTITSCKIFSTTGQQVINENLPNSILDVSELPEGIYFLCLEFINKNTKTFKIKN